MNPRVWVASGHVSTFNDPLIDCRACKIRHRADKLVEEWNKAKGITDVSVKVWTIKPLFHISGSRAFSVRAAGRAISPIYESSTSC